MDVRGRRCGHGSRVDDIDAWYQRAVAAGCTATMPPADMFWGDRYGQLKDPFGSPGR